MKKSRYTGKKKAFYKRKEFFTYLIGIFIIMLMVLSVINLNSESEFTAEYNGIKFAETGNGFVANIGKEQIIILANPEEFETIETQKVNINSLNSLQKIYISVDPYGNYQNALYDLSRNINLYPQLVTACYEDSEPCADLPLKTCEDTTDTTGVIIFKQSNETLLSLNDNCLTIQGKDLLKVTDKLILDQYEN